MSDWKNEYKSTPTLENVGTALKKGKYRAIIDFAEETVSKTGKDMIVVEFLVSGCGKSTIKNFFVKSNFVNYYLTRFFNSFGIDEGDFDFRNWVGKEGAIAIEKVGKYFEVKGFLSREECEALPPYDGEMPMPTIEPSKRKTTIDECVQEAEDEDLPF